jgi:hypothetical protein
MIPSVPNAGGPGNGWAGCAISLAAYFFFASAGSASAVSFWSA